MKVAEAVAQTLIDEGLDRVFCLLGDANLHITYYLHEAGIPIIEGRHEASVFAMADGYSRSTGKVTLCSVTSGPALAHTFTPMVSAARVGSSVVVLSGERTRDDLLERQWLDLRGMTAVTGAGFVPVFSAHTAVDRARQVMDYARYERKPVVFDIPANVQDQEFQWDLVPRPTPGWHKPQRPQADPVLLEEAVEMIAASERPIIVAGWGATQSDARDELLGLAEQADALVGTAMNARGYFHGNPYNLGVAGLFSSLAAAELYGEADLIVSFGASLNRYTTESGYLFGDAQVIQVDVKSPRPMASGDAADLYIQGDAKAVAQALNEALAAHPRKSRYRSDDIAKRLAEDPDPWTVELEPGLLDPRDVTRELDELLPENVGWVSGNSGHFWSFPIMHMPRWRQPMLFGTYFGAVGYGLSVAIGTAVGNEGRPTLVIEGDAGLMMYPNNLETAARYNTHLLVVVLNDGALGAEYHKMTAKGYKTDLSLTPETDIAGVARAFGVRAETLTDMADLPGMVDRFLNDDGPMLIDARTSRLVTSKQFRRVHGGSD